MHGFAFEIAKFLNTLGYIGILLGLIVEFVPIEMVLIYGGVMVGNGDITFFGSVIAGVLGGVLSQIIFYWIGLYGGKPFVMKYGKYFFVLPKHLEKAEGWLNRYGWYVFLINPVFRSLSISLAFSKMRLSKFISFSIFSTIPWTVFLLYLGVILKRKWFKIQMHIHHYLNGLFLIILLLVVVHYLYKYLKNKIFDKKK